MKVIKYLFVASLLILNCSEKNNISEKKVTIQFRFVETDYADSLISLKVKNFEKVFYIHKEILLNENDISEASVVEWQGEFAVQVKFTEPTKIKWAKITGNNVGKRIGILVNDELVTAPIIRAQIDQGIAIINGGFSKTEAESIAQSLKNN